jgi:hypothetical protein
MDCNRTTEPVRAQPRLYTNVYYRRNRSWKHAGCTLASRRLNQSFDVSYEWWWLNQAICCTKKEVRFLCTLCTFLYICNREKKLGKMCISCRFGLKRELQKELSFRWLGRQLKLRPQRLTAEVMTCNTNNTQGLPQSVLVSVQLRNKQPIWMRSRSKYNKSSHIQIALVWVAHMM